MNEQREIDALKSLIAGAIWTIECLVEEYEDDDKDTKEFINKLKEAIKLN